LLASSAAHLPPLHPSSFGNIHALSGGEIVSWRPRQYSAGWARDECFADVATYRELWSMLTMSARAAAVLAASGAYC
jgi:hypothetical protein